MGIVRVYTEAEIGGLLKLSENNAVSGQGGRGHAEGLHEIQAVGKGRASTSVPELNQRIVDELEPTASAFDGTQVKAITFALNSSAGQTALSYLNHNDVDYIFAVIDISNQNLAAVEAIGEVFHWPMESRKIAVAAAPIGTKQIRPQFVAMKRIKSGDDIHIRTAYPTSKQELPI